MKNERHTIPNSSLFNEAELFSRDSYLPIEIKTTPDFGKIGPIYTTNGITHFPLINEILVGDCIKKGACEKCSHIPSDWFEYRKNMYHFDNSSIKRDSYIIKTCALGKQKRKPDFKSKLDCYIDRLPKNVIERSNLSNETIAYIIYEKFIKRKSLGDISRWLLNYGIIISTEALCDLVIAVSRRMNCIIERMKNDVLSGPIILFDYIPINIEKTQYIWIAKGKIPYRDIALLGNSVTMPGSDARKWFYGFSGFLFSEGFDRYSSFQYSKHVFPLSKIQKAFNSFDRSTAGNELLFEANNYIGKIMQIDRKRRLLLTNGEICINEFLLSRNSESKKVFFEFKKWLISKQSLYSHDTPFGKVISYALYHIESSTRYLDHYLLSPHMNETETELSPFSGSEVMWSFSQACERAQCSFDIYSILRTAILNGLDPHDYLLRCFSALSDLRGNEVVEDLLPYKQMKGSPKISQSLKNDN
jgi:transposase